MRKLGALGNISSVSSNISSTSPYPNGNWTSNAVANTKDILKVVLVKEVTQQVLKVDGLKFNYEAPVVELGGWGRVDGESLGVTTATLKSAGVGCTTKGTIYSNYSASGYAGPAQVGFTVDSKGSLGNLSLISNGRYPDNWGTPNYAPTTWTRNESARSYNVGVYTSNNDSNYTKNQTITINESQQEFILDITSTSAFKYILFKIESTDTIATTMSLKSIEEHFVTKIYIPSKRMPTKYYKYTYENWTRPNLTANGTLGGSSFAVSADYTWGGYPEYQAVDGNSDTYWISGQGTKASFIFYNPTPLIVTKISTPKQWVDSGIYASVGDVYGSNDNSTWTKLGSFTGGTYNNGFSCNLSSNKNEYTYYKITPTTTAGTAWGISELQITAKIKAGSVESTSSDYDYKATEIKKYLPIRRISTKYYKYVYKNWTQPVLSTNGTLGGTSFAVKCSSDQASQYPAYYAFDNNSSSFAVTHNTDFVIYNFNPLNITKISLANRENAYTFNGGAIYGGNNGSDWTLVKNISGQTWDLSSNTKYYKYYKLVQTTSGDWQPVQITITAKEQTSVESTSSDYDYKVTENKLYI